MFRWKTNNGCTIRLLKIGLTNCYFIEYQNLIILVDTGQRKSVTKLRNALKSYIPNGRSLNYILLSHTHYDHVENAEIIKNEFSAKIIVHNNEFTELKEGYTRLPKGTNIFTMVISNLGNIFAKWIGRYESLIADIIIEDDYFIDSNPYFRIIETKGHSKGSVSLIIDNEIAIVGDTFFGSFPKSIFPPFADNKTELLKSWEKLFNTNCSIFLPGHGKSINRKSVEKELNKRLKNN